MKAVVRVLIIVLSLVVAGAVTAPGASAVPVTGSAAAVQAVDPAVPGTVVSVPPTRVADSRIGLQLPGPVGPFGTGIVRVTGCCGIPESGFFTVVTTVTVVSPQQTGYLTAFPSETVTPGTSNLNFTAGRTTANTVLMSPGLEAGVDIFNGSPGPVQVIVDVIGYIPRGTSTAPGSVVPVFPVRIADFRIGQQIQPLGALTTHDVQVSGRGGVPSGGVAAVIATIAAVDPEQAGYLTAWQGGTARPGTSNVNFQAGQTIANTMVLPLGADGKIRVFNGSGGGVQSIVDVNAYIRAGTPTTAGTVATVTPARVADSRVGWQIPGAVPAAAAAAVKVTGIGGIPANGVAAVVATVTVVAPRAAGYATVWPSGASQPGTSNLNFAAGQTVATTVIAPVGPDGQIQVRNGSAGAADLIVDVTGYTLAVPGAAGGAAWAWGWGYYGQLGNGDTADSALPVAVAGPNTVTAIAGGALNGYALRSDGTVWAWGYGASGELGNGGTTDSAVPVQVAGLGNITAITGGNVNGYALRGDGTVWAWGVGRDGELGNGSTVDSPVPVQVSGLTHITAIAGNAGSGYALRRDGTMWAWGLGDLGQLGNGSTTNSPVPVQVSGLTTITAIGGGVHTGYAVRADGTAWAWGSGYYGALGNGGTTDSAVPVQVSGLTHITAIAGNAGSGYALRSDGTVWAWGAGYYGQLGNGGNTDSAVPVRVSGPNDITAIAAGSATAYALRADGTALAWGLSDYGQLGDGGTTNSATPVQISGLVNITAIACRHNTGYAITH